VTFRPVNNGKIRIVSAAFELAFVRLERSNKRMQRASKK